MSHVFILFTSISAKLPILSIYSSVQSLEAKGEDEGVPAAVPVPVLCGVDVCRLVWKHWHGGAGICSLYM